MKHENDMVFLRFPKMFVSYTPYCQAERSPPQERPTKLGFSKPWLVELYALYPSCPKSGLGIGNLLFDVFSWNTVILSK